MMKITAVQIDPPKLHKTIVAYFSLDDLQALCFDLSLNFDELPPGGLSTRARGLVEMCQRQRRLVALAEAVLVQRPHIPQNAFLRDIADDDAPFKGLLAFEEADEEIFFGREELTAELVARVTDATNFLALVGASGSGKSSVARAGMIPQLRRQTNWPIHLITPTAHPLQALATSLTRDSESVTATATLIDDLQKESRALRLYAARLLQNSSADRLLLVIDQFEELFTLCKDEAERTAFVENLVVALVQGGQVTVLLTLRADFYHHCLQYQLLHHLLESQQKIVPSMSIAELRAAIELPAQQGNLTFDNGLVNTLLRDVGAADNQTPEPGALPLLSHALLETWQRRELAENRLTLAGYTEAGGVQGAIAKTAESTYQQLPADQQKIARSIFLRLTKPGEGTQDTRRRAGLTELLPQNDARSTVEQVINTLANARLLTTSEDGVEVAHEALIRKWPMLQRWLDENREGLHQHRQLTEAASSWIVNNRDSGYLYRGGQLEKVQRWANSTYLDLASFEIEFLDASGKAHAADLELARKIIEMEEKLDSLLEVDELKSKFVATVSHDLRAPLTYMRGYATMVPMVDELSPKQHEYLDKILGGIDQMSQLVDDLLDLGRIEAGVDLAQERIDVKPLLEGIAEEYWQHAHLAGIKLHVDVADDISTVMGDGSLIRQALTNLLGNGIKYAPNSGPMWLRAEQKNGELFLSVQDGGPGIPKQDQLRLFEKFYRVKQLGTEKVKGTGLGLAIVRSIAERHGGTAGYQSQEGHGSTFYISIPSNT